MLGIKVRAKNVTNHKMWRKSRKFSNKRFCVHQSCLFNQKRSKTKRWSIFNEFPALWLQNHRSKKILFVTNMSEEAQKVYSNKNDSTSQPESSVAKDERGSVAGPVWKLKRHPDTLSPISEIALTLEESSLATPTTTKPKSRRGIEGLNVTDAWKTKEKFNWVWNRKRRAQQKDDHVPDT